MLLLDNTSKKFLKKAIKEDFGFTSMTKLFKEVNDTIKQDSENVDLSGFQNRCNWIISKIVDDKETILKYSETDSFKELFKNVNISSGENSISLNVNNIEVTGNTRFLAITLMLYAFGLLTNMKTLGDNFSKIGGALIEKFSETLTLEFGKRCDLSKYTINGDVIRVIGQSVHQVSPLVNLFNSVFGMLLLKEPDKVVQTLLLLYSRSIKSQVNASIGYLYSFLTKAGEQLNMDFEFLSKDIYYQFKVIVPV